MNAKFRLSAFLLIFSFVFNCQPIIGQEIENATEEQGRAHNRKGILFFQNNNIDSAVFYIKKACYDFEQIKSWGNYVCTLNTLAYLYKEDSNYGLFKETTTKAYTVVELHSDVEMPCLAAAISNLNVPYYMIGNFDKSIEFLNQALEINIKRKANKLELAKNYLNLGNSYRSLGDYQNAFFYLNKSLQTRKDTLPNDPLIASSYGGIAKVFVETNELDSAILYYEKAEQLLKPVQTNKGLAKKKAQNFLSLADLWNKKKNSEKSMAYIDKALQLSPSKYYQAQAQDRIGSLKLSQKEYQDALHVFQEAQSFAEKNNTRNTPPFKARRLMQMAEANILLKNYGEALSNYQNGLITLCPNFDNIDYQSNPEATQFLDKPDGLTILNGKAKTLFQLYTITKEQQYLKAAYDTYVTAQDLISDMRQGFLNSDAKNALAKISVATYEGAIKSALELYLQTKDEKYQAAAFHFAESNKASLLLENLNEQSARGFSGMPDSLFQLEKELKLNLAYTQKKALSKKTISKNYSDQIFNLQQQLNKITAQLEVDYPRYFKLKYQNDPVPLKEIQQELKRLNKVLLEYFVGEEAIYTFLVTSTSLEIGVIDQTDIVFENIKQLRNALNTAPGAIDATLEFNQFTNPAYILYNALLQPVLTQLPDNFSNLIIIPDYQLNYIPFDILLMEAATPQQAGYTSDDLAYVMEKFQISYHYSATLMHKNKQRKKQSFENEFIGFAPSFKETNTVASRACTSDELYSLRCSEEEVGAISTLLDGLTFSGEQANKVNFKQEARESRILHLATHACVDENNSEVNKIFLTDDFLSNFDLYNMELKAELAVLSACNTGAGELVKGEGVMSLARGFINAGCASTLMSMWSVDDCATSDIMLRFYKELKNGLSKDEALRNAKLGYINTTSKSKAHPYYWAAFVQFGDTSAIEFRSSLPWIYILGGVALLLSLFFIVKYK